jgi:hypothetical protein
VRKTYDGAGTYAVCAEHEGILELRTHVHLPIVCISSSHNVMSSGVGRDKRLSLPLQTTQQTRGLDLLLLLLLEFGLAIGLARRLWRVSGAVHYGLISNDIDGPGPSKSSSSGLL